LNGYSSHLGLVSLVSSIGSATKLCLGRNTHCFIEILKAGSARPWLCTAAGPLQICLEILVCLRKTEFPLEGTLAGLFSSLGHSTSTFILTESLADSGIIAQLAETVFAAGTFHSLSPSASREVGILFARLRYSRVESKPPQWRTVGMGRLVWQP
jgi:hypothetical protein